MVRKQLILAALLLGVLHPVSAALFHQKMGSSYILAPDDPTEMSDATRSDAFQRILVDYNTVVAEKKGGWEKRAQTLNQLLIKQSLKDRRIYLGSARSKAQIKAAHDYNQFIPLTGVAAAEQSGVLLAHEKGFLGAGVSVIVVENVDFLLAKGMKDRVKTYHEPYAVAALAGKELHAESVTNVLYQIAPKADIHLISAPDVRAAATSLLDHKVPTYPWFQHQPAIYNWSGSGMESKEMSKAAGEMELLHTFFQRVLVEGKGILIKAVPNNNGSWLKRVDVDQELNEEVLAKIQDHLIMVGNLNGIIENSEDAVTPTPPQQEAFLCAIGDILTPHERHSSGTSFAAPTVSGAAALIKSAYPQFSLQDVRNILLESAQTTFWAKKYSHLSFVYNPNEFKESGLPPISPPPEDPEEYSKMVIPFAPEKFGRGLLSVPRALLYAALKAKNPGLTTEQLKPLFQKTVYEQQHQAATKIQALWRGAKAKKAAK